MRVSWRGAAAPTGGLLNQVAASSVSLAREYAQGEGNEEILRKGERAKIIFRVFCPF